MTTRTRRNWKPDARGYYARHLGWKRTRAGKLQQHKFLLGTDRQEAERREHKLRELWENYADECDETRPLWPDDLLSIAKQIAQGTPEIVIPRSPGEPQAVYAGRIQRIQAKYPVVLFLPEDRRAYEVGQSALELFASLPPQSPPEISPIESHVARALEQARQHLQSVGLDLDPNGLVPPHPAAVESDRPRYRLSPRDPALARLDTHPQPRVSSPAPPEGGIAGHIGAPTPSSAMTATLHQAMRDYQKYLRREYHSPEIDQISAWGKTQVRQIKNLMKHHSDFLLTRLNADAVNELIGYWRRRPCRLGTKTPMTPKSCSNYLGTLIRFLKWLDNSSRYEWSKPLAFSDVDTRVRRLSGDHAKKSLEQVETFSLDELRLLMRYGQPFERLLLLLGLNCGFGAAEIASLLVGEIHLFEAHEARHQEILGYETTSNDSFIKRIRRKSGVYGEHILFPMTVEGVRWALDQRQQFAGYQPEARLLLSRNGTPLDQPTKGGNRNQIIPNHFTRLIKRIQEDGQEIRSLSFGKLRKTATDLIKRNSTGEIAGVFDCHGTPVKTDSLSDQYSNRPFGKVFQAIREVQEYLALVFAEAGPLPFMPQTQAYTKQSTLDQIVALFEAGVRLSHIADTVNLSPTTVKRHLDRHLATRSEV